MANIEKLLTPQELELYKLQKEVAKRRREDIKKINDENTSKILDTLNTQISNTIEVIREIRADSLNSKADLSTEINQLREQTEAIKQLVISTDPVSPIIDRVAQLEEIIKKKDFRGPKGLDGKDGKDGKDGRSITGPKGDKGDKGDKGEKGDNGSPDTALDIRNKLQTLQKDERLDVSAIKGVDTLASKVALAVQQGVPPAIRIHNDLTGRDVPATHPASSIQYGDGNVSEILDNRVISVDGETGVVDLSDTYQPIGSYITTETDPVWTSEKGNYSTTLEADLLYQQKENQRLSTTDDVDFQNITSLDTLQFNLAFSDGHAEGRLQWNADDGTLEYGLPGNTVNLQIGQEEVVKVSNGESTPILNGQVVTFVGSQGGRPKAFRCIAGDAVYGHPCGVATETINQNGYVTTHGLVRDLNTNALSVGIIYVSGSGGYSNTRPTAPNEPYCVGLCLVSNAENGVVYVNPQNIKLYSELDSRYLKLDCSNDPLTGDLLIKPTTNSTTTFQVQPSASTTPTLVVDTTNGGVGIGSALLNNSALTVSKNFTTTTTNFGADFSFTFTPSADVASAQRAVSAAAAYAGANRISNGQALNMQATITNTNGSNSAISGLLGRITLNGAGRVVTGNGVWGFLEHQSTGASTSLNAFRATINKTGAGALTNATGLYVDNIAVATNNYAIYTNAGLNRLGDQLSIIGSADRIQTIIRAHSTQTANLTEWQNSSGSILTCITSNGYVQIGTAPAGFETFSFTVNSATGGIVLNRDSATLEPFLRLTNNTAASGGQIRGVLGGGIKLTDRDATYTYFSADLNGVVTYNGQAASTFTEPQISLGFATSGTYKHFIHTRHNNANSSNAIDFYVSDGTSAGVYPTNAVHCLSMVSGNVGIGTTTPSAKLQVNGDASGITSIFRANATTPGNLTEWQNSSGTVLASICPVGCATFNETGSATGDFRVESDTEENMIFLDANADTDGALYLGGSTNGIKINKGGELTLIGTATVYDDQQVQLGAVRTGASSPTWTPYKGGEVLAFSKNLDNKIFFNIQFSHRVKVGSTAEFHVHTIAPDNATGNVVWQLTASYSSITGTFPTETTTTVTQTISANSADKHLLFDITNTLASNVGISGLVICSLTRLGSDSGDTYDNVIYLSALDSHIEIDGMGSKEEMSK